MALGLQGRIKAFNTVKGDLTKSMKSAFLIDYNWKKVN